MTMHEFDSDAFRKVLKEAFYAGSHCIKYGSREGAIEFTNEEKEQEFAEFIKDRHPEIHLKDLLAQRLHELAAAMDKVTDAQSEVGRINEEIANLQEQIDGV